MSTERWVIASSSGVDAATLSRKQREGFIGFKSLEEICAAVVDMKPDFLASDVIMPGGDAGELARRISLERIESMPVMLVLAPEGMISAAREIAREIGAYAVLRKPVSGDELSSAVAKARLGDRLARGGADKGAITRLLWKLGFSPAVCGFEYALTAVDFVSRDMRAVNEMSASLYPQIAEMYETDAGRVESAIRRAMESAWSSGSPKTQYALFANTIDEGRGKPTLAQMFACIAERLYSGMEIDI